ncbi:MAG: hypothetical protein LBV18_06940 [Alistipes sp.]|jgi:hypothetical protein|nr:hypothetical protein [Alistipes sp.]
MAKSKKKCTPLESNQSQQLARLIIAQAEVDIHRGANRKKRVAAPSGCVMLF